MAKIKLNINRMGNIYTPFGLPSEILLVECGITKIEFMANKSVKRALSFRCIAVI